MCSTSVDVTRRRGIVMAYEIKRFPYAGTVDADGHVLEPADLWENYLEENYQARALAHQGRRRRLRVSRDRPASVATNGAKDRSAFSARWATTDLRPRPDRRYADNMPFGSSNADERLRAARAGKPRLRVALSDDRVVVGGRAARSRLSLAYMRAYNRWIADFCRSSSGRLVPIAQLTLLDPGARRQNSNAP